MSRLTIEDRRFALIMRMEAFGLLLYFMMAAASPAIVQAQPAEALQQKLEVFWTDLYGDDPTATSAAIQFYKHAAAAVPFLKQKLPPLKLDEDECRRLLEDLGADEERVWKAAWEKLDYLDPRLAFDLSTLMDEVVDVPARTRLVELCSHRKADSLVEKNVNIRLAGVNGYNFFDGQASWWAEHRVNRIGHSFWDPKMAWTRAARCIAILEQIGSPEALEVLEQLASGHLEAMPTQAAKVSLARLKK